MTQAEATDRIGKRHIFGVFAPEFNSVIEPELADLRPAGVSNQTTRFALNAEVIQQIGQAAEGMLPSGVQSWIIGLSTESFPGGLTLLEQGVEALRDRTGLPVFTAPHSTRHALEALKANRIAIVTPFDDATNQHVCATYEGWGYSVLAMNGLARPGFDQIANTPDKTVQEAFESVSIDRVEAFVQVGGGLPMLHQIEGLEDRLGRPIVAANLATYWHALRAAKIQDLVSGAGKLFNTEF